MGFEGFPLIVGWELTLACNLRCRHCGSSAALPRRSELTLEEALAVCDQLPALLVHEVDFTGGEPLLRPDWWRIALRLQELGIATKVITNGLKLGPDTIVQLMDTGVAELGVSIDGLEATHDYVRDRAGLFQQVVGGIGRAVKAGLPVAAITTVNALNIDELPALAALLRSLGVVRWQVQPIFPLGRGQISAELQLDEDSYLQLGAFAREWGPQLAEIGPDLALGDSFGYYTELDEREPPWRGCPAGLVVCGIMSDGRIKGCLSMPDDLVDGDLREHDLWDIWFHPDAFAYNRKFQPDDLGPTCRTCDRAEQCLGGCSAMSWGATGRLHNDPFCFTDIQRRSSGVLANLAALAQGQAWNQSVRVPRRRRREGRSHAKDRFGS